MDLNEIRIFVKVVQAGSFSQAARALGMPNSTVSTKVSDLEKRLGTTLLQRTTRKLHLTQAGEVYFKRGNEALEILMAAEAEATTHQSVPQGLLKITAPVEVGNTLLADLVRDFVRKHPKISVELILTDRVTDLIGEGIDLAIRAGALEDSSLMARRLGYSHFAPFASPTYLKRRGTPDHPKDLEKHETLRFTTLNDDHWILFNGKDRVRVRTRGTLASNDLISLRSFAVKGQGIALMPTYICSEELARKRLTRILPEWFSYPEPVHWVYPAHRFMPPKLHAFLEMATDPLKVFLGGALSSPP